MADISEIRVGSSLKGILRGEMVSVVAVKPHGSRILELTYTDTSGNTDQRMVYEDELQGIEVVTVGQPWSFDADSKLLRLVSEAYRINLAYLFDPMLAVHTSTLEPLPHQITAVYQEMLTRQPLRFLLADDPGAGKTIMTGLLVKELVVRGDLKRCLVCCPGNLVDQWQDELWQRFQLDFSIISRQSIEDSKSGNPFADKDLVIGRLDHMSRNDDIKDKLSQTDWDLIVCDEAHKMSAHYFSGEIKETKRYKLGRLLSETTRHFLLLTATPHNGKEEDFQLFMALIDGDRFEGRFRDGAHVTDTSDIMRRMVKENLYKFDGTRLFPERNAYTVTYSLSDDEVLLYKQVTDYVREEFNRADRLENDGRKGNVGFALTILQRRLASSPEAIYQSLKRRRKRLEKRLREEKLEKRGLDIQDSSSHRFRSFDQEDVDDFEDAPAEELESMEEEIVDQATAAKSIAELEAEIRSLDSLERLADRVRKSGRDTKWEELSRLLQENVNMFDESGNRRKLVVFTEHKDTLTYLTNRIRTFLGQGEVVNMHGGMGREDRKKAQNAFTQDKDVLVLVATDAAGEGINLQRAHLMVNYDLPWNPNRLEQRFGRIHRIGQTEVCHLWNLVAMETREGDVFQRLLEKLETAKEALGGGVFDVLGQVFQGVDLRELLIKAIRYGESPEIKSKLEEKVDGVLDHNRLRKLLEERALTYDSMDIRKVQEVRREMERAEARRLQPHYIASFFIEAFTRLGGTIRERESKRYEITRVPASVKMRDRQIGVGSPVLHKYERVTFHKDKIAVKGKPIADLICPGHPLLDATVDLVLEQNRDLLKQGGVMVDENDFGEEIRALFYLESRVYDARKSGENRQTVASRELTFVEIDSEGNKRAAGYAPYLDYRPIEDEEKELVEPILQEKWLNRDLAEDAKSYAIEHLVPRHYQDVKGRKVKLVNKTMAAVHDRLTKEINYWDHRTEEIKAKELAGKKPKLNSAKARQRADDLEARLKKRMDELEREKTLSTVPPVLVGGAIVIPQGLINKLKGDEGGEFARDARERKRVERAAVQAVMEVERSLGYTPIDVGSEKRGYDIESEIPNSGKLRFIEVKGRSAGNKSVIVTRNEILCALNKPDDFILAIGIVGENSTEVHYLNEPFGREPDFGVTSVTYDLSSLLGRSERMAT